MPHFNQANLHHARLDGADLHDLDFIGASLYQASLRSANLSGAHFYQADLTGATLVEATFTGARFRSSDLSGASLRGVDLRMVDLSGAILRSTDFYGASLMNTDLRGALLNATHLTDVDLTGAVIGSTSLVDVDLSKVRGLEAVQHSSPSSIGIDTIYRSHGIIPVEFLRKAGVRDEFITYMPSLVGQAIKYHSCFMSYSSKDEEFARLLHTDLKSNGINCFFAPRDLKPGDDVASKIDEAIRLREKLLIILSKDSVESEWVETEVQAAIKKGSPDTTVLFPIRIDDAVMETERAWAVDLRKKHIADFRNWGDRSSYREALVKLLDDLVNPAQAKSASSK